jgi:hypothetical protein
MTQSQGGIEQLHLLGDHVTDTEKLRCVERELALRRRVYARQVQGGRMSPATAAIEIKVMSAIVEDYRRLTAREGLL